MTENNDVKIFIDIHEASSKIPIILSKHCITEEKQLPVGDYLLSKRIAVERKTTSDFLSSIVDGRLFKQMEDMKNNFRHPILLIEGNNLFSSERKIHPNAIRGAIASIMIDYGIPIIRTENNLETAEMLVAIAKREQLEGRRSNSIRGKKAKKSVNHMQEYLVSGLPKINRSKAKSLLKHFGSPEKIFAASKEELVQVDGIGDKLAEKIHRIITKKYEKSILED